MPRWPKREEGMEQPKRARRRKPETAKANLEPPLKELRRTGCLPRGGSEGYAEKYRAVVNGGYSKDEPVGQRWGKVEPALWRRRRSHREMRRKGYQLTRYADDWVITCASAAEARAALEAVSRILKELGVTSAARLRRAQADGAV